MVLVPPPTTRPPLQSGPKWSNKPDLSRVFRAEHISTLLAGSASVEVKEPAAEAAASLRGGRFDQAPVTDGGRVVGWVLTEDLDRTGGDVDSVYRRLDRCTILAVDAPLTDLLPVLGTEQMVLLAGSRGLESFVTPSDLDRNAARGHLYLLVSSVEMLLADIVTARLEPAIVEGAISGPPRRRWKEAVAAGLESRPVEYLNLGPLTALFENHVVAAAVDSSTVWDDEARTALSELVRLRNSVAHAVIPILKEWNARQLGELLPEAERVLVVLRSFL